jgi:hypothetical protein
MRGRTGNFFVLIDDRRSLRAVRPPAYHRRSLITTQVWDSRIPTLDDRLLYGEASVIDSPADTQTAHRPPRATPVIVYAGAVSRHCLVFFQHIYCVASCPSNIDSRALLDSNLLRFYHLLLT